jgi:hypothetical protein
MKAGVAPEPRKAHLLVDPAVTEQNGGDLAP